MNELIDFNKNDVLNNKQYINQDDSKDSINIDNFNVDKQQMYLDENHNSKIKIYSSIKFSKNNLFFKSRPNEISFDSVILKNIGTTCVYFKWQKKQAAN